MNENKLISMKKFQNLIKAPQESVDYLDIPSDAKELLVDYGLPKNYYDFSFVIDEDLQELRFFETSSNEWATGWKLGCYARNSEICICISKSGVIGSVSSTNKIFELLNSHLRAFIQCLSAYAEVQQDFEDGILNGEDPKVRESAVQELRMKILSIDKSALEDENGYWANLLFEMEFGL